MNSREKRERMGKASSKCVQILGLDHDILRHCRLLAATFTDLRNTVAIIKEKQNAHTALVDAMSRGESVGRCIEIIEQSL